MITNLTLVRMKHTNIKGVVLIGDAQKKYVMGASSAGGSVSGDFTVVDNLSGAGYTYKTEKTLLTVWNVICPRSWSNLK